MGCAVGRLYPGPAGCRGLRADTVPGTILPNLPQGMVLTIQPPRNWGGSTTAVFIRNPADTRYGKPGIRLDYGMNRATGRVDYHWNVEGGARARARFPEITNHLPAGRGGAAVYWGARAFRVTGRVFVVAGAAIDIYSIAVADRPFRRAVQMASAWGVLPWVRRSWAVQAPRWERS